MPNAHPNAARWLLTGARSLSQMEGGPKKRWGQKNEIVMVDVRIPIPQQSNGEFARSSTIDLSSSGQYCDARDLKVEPIVSLCKQKSKTEEVYECVCVLHMMSQNDKSDAGREEAGVEGVSENVGKDIYSTLVPLLERHSRRMLLGAWATWIRVRGCVGLTVMHLHPGWLGVSYQDVTQLHHYNFVDIMKWVHWVFALGGCYRWRPETERQGRAAWCVPKITHWMRVVDWGGPGVCSVPKVRIG